MPAGFQSGASAAPPDTWHHRLAAKRAPSRSSPRPFSPGGHPEGPPPGQIWPPAPLQEQLGLPNRPPLQTPWEGTGPLAQHPAPGFITYQEPGDLLSGELHNPHGVLAGRQQAGGSAGQPLRCRDSAVAMPPGRATFDSGCGQLQPLARGPPECVADGRHLASSEQPPGSKFHPFGALQVASSSPGRKKAPGGSAAQAAAAGGKDPWVAAMPPAAGSPQSLWGERSRPPIDLRREETREVPYYGMPQPKKGQLLWRGAAQEEAPPVPRRRPWLGRLSGRCTQKQQQPRLPLAPRTGFWFLAAEWYAPFRR